MQTNRSTPQTIFEHNLSPNRVAKQLAGGCPTMESYRDFYGNGNQARFSFPFLFEKVLKSSLSSVEEVVSQLSWSIASSTMESCLLKSVRSLITCSFPHFQSSCLFPPPLCHGHDSRFPRFSTLFQSVFWMMHVHFLSFHSLDIKAIAIEWLLL